MNLEMIQEYIDPQLIIVVPMLWGIGMAVKKSTITNKFIPLFCWCFPAVWYCCILQAQTLWQTV